MLTANDYMEHWSDVTAEGSAVVGQAAGSSGFAKHALPHNRRDETYHDHYEGGLLVAQDRDDERNPEDHDGDSPDFATALSVVAAEHDSEYREAFGGGSTRETDSRQLLHAAQALDAEVQRLVAAGEAANEEEALMIACQNNGEMYRAYLATQCAAQ